MSILSYIMARTSYIQWNDDDVHFILDQHVELDFYFASSVNNSLWTLRLLLVIPCYIILIILLCVCGGAGGLCGV
jgi:hypothetical protein